MAYTNCFEDEGTNGRNRCPQLLIYPSCAGPLDYSTSCSRQVQLRSYTQGCTRTILKLESTYLEHRRLMINLASFTFCERVLMKVAVCRPIFKWNNYRTVGVKIQVQVAAWKRSLQMWLKNFRSPFVHHTLQGAITWITIKERTSQNSSGKAKKVWTSFLKYFQWQDNFRKLKCIHFFIITQHSGTPEMPSAGWQIEYPILEMITSWSLLLSLCAFVPFFSTIHSWIRNVLLTFHYHCPAWSASVSR